MKLHGISTTAYNPQVINNFYVKYQLIDLLQRMYCNWNGNIAPDLYHMKSHRISTTVYDPQVINKFYAKDQFVNFSVSL